MSRRALAITVGLAALALALLNHFHGHQLYLNRLDVDQTLLSPAPIAPGGEPRSSIAAPLRARHLWVVMIDGLRDDLADRVPAIRGLAARGVRRRLEAEFPSYTLPNITTMATGVPPLYSGVRLNSGRRHVRVETLLDVAKRHGVKVVIAREWAGYDGALDRQNAADLPHSLPAAMPRLLGEGRGMAWIFDEEVDKAGHEYGAAAPQYLAASHRAGELLARIAALIDLDRDVLIALSDHGHRDRGGHGGVEREARGAFFLAVGKNIRRGARLDDARMRDIAPTLALLAGLPPPADSLGAPMVDLLDAPLEAAAQAPFLAQRFAVERRLRAGFAARGVELPALSSTPPPSLAAFAEIEAARERAVAAFFRRLLPPRLLVAGGLTLAVLALLFIARRRGLLRLRLADHLPLLVYLALFHLGYHLLGYRWSWSIGRGLARFLIETALLGFAAGWISLFVGRLRSQAARRVEQAATHAWLWIAYLLAVCVEGTDTRWMHDPFTSWTVIYLATSEFYFAIVFGVAALLSSRTSRPSPLPQSPPR